jgi:hypothetical protein
MVPGDWVYMKNTPQYTGEYWNGENAIYMGQYDSVLNGTPVWKVGATQRFTGLGVPITDPATGQWTGQTLANRNFSITGGNHDAGLVGAQG